MFNEAPLPTTSHYRVNETVRDVPIEVVYTPLTQEQWLWKLQMMESLRISQVRLSLLHVSLFAPLSHTVLLLVGLAAVAYCADATLYLPIYLSIYLYDTDPACSNGVAAGNVSEFVFLCEHALDGTCCQCRLFRPLKD
eukprot:GFYU01036199.1.p1 GENE.GFYU01036199.1~~GFYU01036199.1.p1  ORF type:complete len:138 (+),score=18.97 GFYU01036199.1:117-530(+)